MDWELQVIYMCVGTNLVEMYSDATILTLRASIADVSDAKYFTHLAHQTQK